MHHAEDPSIKSEQQAHESLCTACYGQLYETHTINHFRSPANQTTTLHKRSTGSFESLLLRSSCPTNHSNDPLMSCQPWANFWGTSHAPPLRCCPVYTCSIPYTGQGPVEQWPTQVQRATMCNVAGFCISNRKYGLGSILQTSVLGPFGIWSQYHPNVSLI